MTNSIVNRTGITLIHALAEDTGMRTADVARAYAAARDLFGLRLLWAQIEALDGKIEAPVQAELFRQTTIFVDRTTRWFLRNAPQPLDVAILVKELESGIHRYMESYESIISDSVAKAYKQKIERFTAQQVPETLAIAMARLEILSSACDIVRVSNTSGKPLAEVGALYFQLGATLRLGWLRRQASRMAGQSHWERIAVYSIIGSLFDEQRRLTASVMAKGTLEEWCGAHEKDIERFSAFIADLKTSDTMTLPKLVIAAKKVEEVGR